MNREHIREQVLRLLERNARLSASQIAERLLLDEALVAELLAEAERENLIRGYHALVDENAYAEQPARALIEVSVEPERDVGFDRIARSLSKFPEVTDLVLVSGSYDLLLTVVGTSLHEVADFVASKLSPHPGVRSTRTHFLLKKYKQAGFQLEDDEDYERLRVSP